MTELLTTIVRQFNNILYYDSGFFHELILNPLLMSNPSFMALYKETVDFYENEIEIKNFNETTAMQKNAIAFKLMVFARRRKSIADGESQLVFFKTIFHEGMVQNKKIFTELIVPWLEDFKVIRIDPKYSTLLNYYTFKTPISDVPMYGDFARTIFDKMYALEQEEYESRAWWGWKCAIL